MVILDLSAHAILDLACSLGSLLRARGVAGRIRLGQSVAASATLTRARPLASKTEIVSIHAEEKRSEDQ